MYTSIRPPLVRRTPFEYKYGALYVCIKDEFKSAHVRADPTQLHAQAIAPIRSVITRHDETTSYYVAQLYHYGLKRTGSMAAARKVILEAWEAQGGTLVVPSRILELELEMKTEYEALLSREQRTLSREPKTLEQLRVQRKREWDENVQAEVDAARRLTATETALSPLPVENFKGTYLINAPKLFPRWPECEHMHLILSPSQCGSHLWGRLSFGIFTGYLRSSTSLLPVFDEDAPPTTRPTTRTIRFKWRGQDVGDPISTEIEYYAKSTNRGSLTFLGEGRIKGSLYVEREGKIEFRGRRKRGATGRERVFHRQVKGWKEGFRVLVDGEPEESDTETDYSED